jgi:hypothetical protein
VSDLEKLAGPCREGIPGIDYLDDNAEEALAMFPVMSRRCADCAFTDGTSANHNPTTANAAAECVQTRHAFWCHKAEDHLGEKTHLCAGWSEAISACTLIPSSRREGL